MVRTAVTRPTGAAGGAMIRTGVTRPTVGADGETVEMAAVLGSVSISAE